MGELLDRNLQREVLGILSNDYPQRTNLRKAFEGAAASWMST